MSINLTVVALLITIILITIMFWIMNDKQANRVTRSWSKLLKVLPISQIIKAFTGNKNDSSKDDKP
jgi:flagellar basal body-associated protein FliL